MKTDFDVIVVGGGMVGACAAALAARELAGLRIALLEAQPPTEPPSAASLDLRVSAVSRGSERILHAAGAWERIGAQHAYAYIEMVVWDAAGRAFGSGSIHFSSSATSEPNLGYIIENSRLTWALYEAPAMRSGVVVLRAELAGLELNAQCATVRLADGRVVTAELVIGADGSASRSRALAGIETRVHEYGQRAFVTQVATEHGHRDTAWQRFLPAGPIAFLPLADGRSSIIWSTTPEHAQELMATAPEEVGKQLTQALGSVLGEVTLTGARAQFPLRQVHAREYCRARFALVGDAAHAVHPLAGQGVNLGFLDCAALIETLAAELQRGDRRSIAELRVLRRYERWRKSENTLALGLIDGLNRLFSNRHSGLGGLRRAGLEAVNRSDFAKRALMGRAMGIAGDAPKLAMAPRGAFVRGDQTR